jgi:DNA-binding NarL/FixJ family response regulator/DMSO/TMAO reductase YedYZ heme-binding membrane subunit
MIRVLIVDDLSMICKGLKEMFVSQPDIEVVGFAHNGKEAIKQIITNKPDVVLIDVLMPIMGGIEATKQISKQFPEVKVIVLSTFEDDPIIKDAITAGAKGYLLKNMMAIDLASAIRSVARGASHFAPGVIDILAKTTLSSTQGENNIVTLEDKITWDGITKEVDNDRSDSTTKVKVKPKVETIPVKPKKETPAKAPSTTSKNPKKVKSTPEKPLFRYGDWMTVVLGIGILSQTEGMGHDLGHAGLFLLMIALIARPIRFWWDAPLKYRRTIGVLAFAAASGHAIYATANVLDSNPEMILAMSPKNQVGIWVGVISLFIMTPAAITSFKYFQKKLGKKWRQIHLLTVPALFFAVLHTILIGPHYLADFQTEFLDHLRTFGVTVVGLLVLLMRRKIFWSVLGLNKLGKQGKQFKKAES